MVSMDVIEPSQMERDITDCFSPKEGLNSSLWLLLSEIERK